MPDDLKAVVERLERFAVFWDQDDDAIEVPVRDQRRAAILTGSETNAR